MIDMECNFGFKAFSESISQLKKLPFHGGVKWDELGANQFKCKPTTSSTTSIDQKQKVTIILGEP